MNKQLRRIWPWLLAIAVVVAIAVLIWWFMRNRPVVTVTDPVERVDDVTPSDQPPPAQETTEASTPMDPFAPQEIMRNPRCSMAAGYGPARDLAVVMLNTSEGLRFAMLDGTGTLFGDQLPFWANHLRLGRQRDGTFVVGFGDLRLNSKEPRGGDAPEAMRIYQGDQVVYETDKTLQFGIALDGTSFYSIEPLAGDASQLKIRHFDLGTEVHIDIGDLYSAVGYDLVYSVAYTLDQTEVHFWQESGDIFYFPDGDKNLFYPTTGGGPLMRTVDPDVFASAVFESSRYGYAARFGRDDGEVIVSKRRFRGDDLTMQEAEEAWSRTINTYLFSGLSLSDDGKWLLVRGRNEYILDTATGEIAFIYPTDENFSRKISPKLLADGSNSKTQLSIAYKQAEFERIKSILPPGATMDDVGTRDSFSLRFRDGLLMMHRLVRTGDGYKDAFDIYDMFDIQIDGAPKVRVDIDPNMRCAPGNLPGWGLQEVDGRLTYLTERITFDTD